MVGRESGVLKGQMVGAQRQFFGGVFAGGSGVEGEFEVACLADKKAVGGQDGAVGIGDGEAEFAGAILRAGQRGDEQEKKSGVGQDAAQKDSPRSAGDALQILYSDHGRRLLDGSATTFGRERACCARLEQAARMLTVRTITFRNGVGEARPSCARLGQPGRLSLRNLGRAKAPVPTQARPNLGAVMAVTVFCEI